MIPLSNDMRMAARHTPQAEPDESTPVPDLTLPDAAHERRLRQERCCAICGVRIIGRDEAELRRRSVAHVQAEHAEVGT